MKLPTHQLEEILRVAHDQRPLPAMDDDWDRRVMHEIQRQAINSTNLSTLAGPLVWRFAAASCCLALAFVSYALSGSDADQLALDLFMGDPLLGPSMRLLALASGL